jgi:hypothetical protein
MAWQCFELLAVVTQGACRGELCDDIAGTTGCEDRFSTRGGASLLAAVELRRIFARCTSIVALSLRANALMKVNVGWVSHSIL